MSWLMPQLEFALCMQQMMASCGGGAARRLLVFICEQKQVLWYLWRKQDGYVSCDLMIADSCSQEKQ